ncbi:MAG: threonine--tRNA ligase [Candidatus Wildermuthbacteria bacterium RIFCSPLOWO2_01_FULL_48_35]|uniref:Threonine--tRNA ligase n=1 Tax=Candidatus Wildermuthbacteria bacterium RIFCSPLOWO2_01_FULL_48_35 TaxID=1802463 RepID=A0A1G2RM11_9BACT|nr:MAG: threonine--tRNA ligase [Candidatus Wildermuthbacteria bacterium RIFCSPLOWO2_01_FULL_48_35]
MVQQKLRGPVKKDAGGKVEPLRHSLAHLMAYAVQEMFPGTNFGIGPVIENGFYYDFDFGIAKPRETPASDAGAQRETARNVIGPDDLPKIEKRMREFVRQNLVFKKEVISKDAAKKIFADQPYKLELIEELAEDTISTYESGDFIDLCRGPHVKNTNEIPPDAFRLTKIAGAYWRGSEKNTMLTRVYGVAFGSKQELDKYLRMQTEAEKRDHRKLGAQLDLFSFHDIAPGAAFWHPKGMVIIKELEKFWREIHEKLGYLETSTPILVKKEIFETSGHWEHYKENMFVFELEGHTYALKPMSCPESTLIYLSRVRSYRDLPLRLSEIGRLHRFELSGVLAGLFRVRQLTMDDAHIYCAPEHLQKEITSVLKLVKEFYRRFGFKAQFFLAARPDDSMGDEKLWQKAEKALTFALKQNKLPYEVKPKDGAFYGPKIDIHITDALGRSWQMATLQLDFQMPLRFQLSYIDQKGRKQQPIMIHRAIFGSFERFIGILLEHFAGNLPLWLAPEQLWIIPIGSSHKKYAKEIAEKLSPLNLRLRINDANETIGKKIRGGEIQKIPYILVVGDKEMQKKTVRVRAHGKGDIGEIKISSFAAKLGAELRR